MTQPATAGIRAAEVNRTASQFLDGFVGLEGRRTAGTSRQALGDADYEPSSQGGEGVRHVPLRPQRQSPAGANLGEPQAARHTGCDPLRRGEKRPAPR
jgi:hypothetical protein